MKKSLNLLLAIVLVFSAFSSLAFAADNDLGARLKAAGVLKGDADGNLNEDENWTREQATVIIARLLGSEDEAQNTEKNHGFTDVTRPFYDGFITWSLERGYFKGHDDTKFGFGESITNKQFAVVMLRVLGVDFNDDWFAGDIEAKAVEFGIFPEDTDWNAEPTRGELFPAIATTIQIERADGTTIAEEQGYAGFYEEKTAEAAAKISSARALTDTLVQVSLSEAIAADDESEYAIADKDGNSVAIINVTVTGEKSVRVQTEGLTAGELYTISANGTSAQFAGIEKDSAKPTLSVSAVDNTTVKVTFNKAVDISGATFTINEAYGNKAALAINNISQNEAQTEVTLTTASQAQVLYSLKVTGFKSLFGVAGDETTVTFVGEKVDESKQSVSGASSRTNTIVVVTFGKNVDKDSAANPANYKIEEVYGNKEVIQVASASVMDTNNQVALTLAAPTKATTLYKLTVSGVKTQYGYDMDTDNNSTTFVGEGADETKLGISSVTAISNTKVQVTFNDLVNADLASNTANYAIQEKYEGQAKLNVLEAKVSNNDVLKNSQAVVTLTVEPMKTVLYEIKLSNLQDDAGNGLVDNPSTTFVGAAVAAKASSVTALMVDRKLELTFDVALDGEAAKNIANYYIEGVGYPSNAVLKDGTNNVVVLTIPSTTFGKIYTVKVTNITNVDGVIQTNTLSANFTGVDAQATQDAKVEAVIAIDKQTIAVYFNQAVSGTNIKGVLYDTNNDLIANKIGLDANKDTFNGSKVYFDSSNPNVVYVRKDTAVFSDNSQKTLFVDKGLVNTTNDVQVPFAAKNNDPVAPALIAAVANNNQTLTLYFNGPVAEPNPVNYAVAGSVTTNGEAGKIVKIDDTTYQVKLAASLTSTGKHTVTVSKANVTDVTGFVAGGPGAENFVVEFAGSTANPGEITGLAATATNKRTVIVYYPELMQTSAGANQAGDANNPANYTIAGNTVHAVEYNASNNTATLYLKNDLAAGKLTVDINTNVANKLGTKTVKDNTSVEFASSSADVPKPTITVTQATYTFTINLDAPIEFADNTDVAANIQIDGVVIGSASHNGDKEITVTATSIDASGVKNVVVKSLTANQITLTRYNDVADAGAIKLADGTELKTQVVVTKP